MAVYLLHFETPLAHAQHYVGFTEDRGNSQRSVETRLQYHLKGRGSKLLAAVAQAGIEVTIARIWPGGTRDFERRLKSHSGTRYCPECRGEVALRRGQARPGEVLSATG